MYLVLNCGSQTIKYEVFESATLEKVAKVNFNEFTDHESKLEEIIDEVVENFDVTAVGHRVVHGGNSFFGPLLIDEDNIEQLENTNHLAPLHNPFNVLGIKKAQERIDAPNIAVFDTGFYRDLPERASTYAIPEDLRSEYKIKRFGFHGISHKYAVEKTAEKAGFSVNDMKIISCHLGGGASITAVNGGWPIDTSMGLTPLEGLVMMTRSGDIDPGVVTLLSKELGPEEVERKLNNNSGMLGLCGSDDMLEILDRAEKGDSSAIKAFEIYTYRIKKYIGAYFAAMNGCDALVFTGGIGAGRAITREKTLEGMDILNDTKIFAISPDEGLMIAKEIKNHSSQQ